MVMENVITKIRNELIRSISGIDAWFDKEALLDHREASGTRTVRELLEDVMLANRYLLEIIDNGRTNSKEESLVVDVPMDKYCLTSQALDQAAIDRSVNMTYESRSGLQVSMHEVRYEIREQLDRCLIHLELLMDGGGSLFTTSLSVGELGRLDVYQSIYFLAVHVRLSLGQLDIILRDHDREMENV
jgi:hypothetical protein